MILQQIIDKLGGRDALRGLSLDDITAILPSEIEDRQAVAEKIYLAANDAVIILESEDGHKFKVTRMIITAEDSQGRYKEKQTSATIELIPENLTIVSHSPDLRSLFAVVGEQVMMSAHDMIAQAEEALRREAEWEEEKQRIDESVAVVIAPPDDDDSEYTF